MKQALFFGFVFALGLVCLLAPRLVANSKLVASYFGLNILASLHRNTKGRMLADLSICEKSSEIHVKSKLIGMVLGFAGGGVTGFMLKFAGGSINSVTPFVFSIAGAFAGFFFPDFQVRQRAQSKRRSFLHSFSSFLDLTNILLAGGAGTETALIAAADSGDGWAFDQIRRVLTISRSSRSSPWIELAKLGDVFNIPQVNEIAGSIQLAGEHGARIRTSLAARAESLRYRQMSEVETSANAATERMGLPMVLLFISFIVLIGYPAVTQVIGGL